MTREAIRAALPDVMVRQSQARSRLVSCLSDLGGITAPEAQKVAALYLRSRIVKLDGVGGQFIVRGGCGAYLEPENIRHVLTTHCA